MAEKNQADQADQGKPEVRQDAEPESVHHSIYSNWTREHLRAETEARRISMREDAEPKEYRTALVADDAAKAEQERIDKANNPNR